jgi:hypothetical protein
MSPDRRSCLLNGSTMRAHLPTHTSRSLLAATFMSLLACGEGAPCVAAPCPQFEAISVSVASATGAANLPGLALTVDGPQAGSGPCDPLGRSCHVLVGAGSYQLTVSATGYVTATRSVTIAGESAGCNTCGRVDRQQITVTLQPQS